MAFVSTNTPVSLWQLSAVRQNKFLLTEGDTSSGLAFSRDGKEVAVAGAKGIRVYDFESEMVTRTIESPRLRWPTRPMARCSRRPRRMAS